jgi:hypothetical protein
VPKSELSVQPQLAQAKAAPDGTMAAKAKASFDKRFMKSSRVTAFTAHKFTDGKPLKRASTGKHFSGGEIDLPGIGLGCRRAYFDTCRESLKT